RLAGDVGGAHPGPGLGPPVLAQAVVFHGGSIRRRRRPGTRGRKAARPRRAGPCRAGGRVLSTPGTRPVAQVVARVVEIVVKWSCGEEGLSSRKARSAYPGPSPPDR